MSAPSPHSRARRRFLLRICVIAAFLAGTLASAGTAGTVQGLVYDYNGQPVEGATVAMDDHKAPSRHALTGRDGRFAARALPAGAFDITVSSPGTCTVLLTGLRLPTDGLAEFDVRLPIGPPQPPCVHVDALRMATRMTPLDERWARLQRECNQGRTASCLDLGDIQEAAERRGLAITAYKQACDAKDGLGCLAIAELPALTPAEYRRRAEPLLTEACEKQSGEACLGLAEIFGSAVRDESRAATLLEKACELGSARACLSLLILPASHQEPRHSLLVERALKLSQEACDAGRGRDCLVLGLLLGEKDSEGARKALRRACDLGQKVACDELRNSS